MLLTYMENNKGPSTPLDKFRREKACVS